VIVSYLFRQILGNSSGRNFSLSSSVKDSRNVREASRAASLKITLTAHVRISDNIDNQDPAHDHPPKQFVFKFNTFMFVTGTSNASFSAYNGGRIKKFHFSCIFRTIFQNLGMLLALGTGTVGSESGQIGSAYTESFAIVPVSLHIYLTNNCAYLT
jgi:hypothetical protein